MYSCIFDGANSQLRVDGVLEASGDAGADTDTVTDEMKAASAAAAWGAADAAATDAMDVADVADAAADMADIDVGADDMDAGGAHM